MLNCRNVPRKPEREEIYTNQPSGSLFKKDQPKPQYRASLQAILPHKRTHTHRKNTQNVQVCIFAFQSGHGYDIKKRKQKLFIYLSSYFLETKNRKNSSPYIFFFSFRCTTPTFFKFKQRIENEKKNKQKSSKMHQSTPLLLVL